MKEQMTQLEAGGRPCLMGRWLRSDGLAMGQVLLGLMRGRDDVAGADAFGRGHHVRLRVQTQDNTLPHIHRPWYSHKLHVQRLLKMPNAVTQLMTNWQSTAMFLSR